MSSSSASSSIGITSSDANDVWRRFCASNGLMRTRRCTPRSADNRPYTFVPRTVSVADLMPASSPCWMSSTSASKPSRSAQRVYMRSSISAQSWLSVPPAPALIVAIASEAS